MIMFTVIFCVLAALLVWVSLKSVVGGVRYYRFFKRSLEKENSQFTPIASVIVPCRGDEPGLRGNLEALFDQDYPFYEIVFVTGDGDDPSVPLIREFLERPRTKLVFAGPAEAESQKVANLRFAVGEVSDESEVLVFVDSDARVSRRWLRSLVAPLSDENVGAATGYRWFIGGRRSLASEMVSCWNASVASRLGEDRSQNFCWGGSTAVLRRTFDRLEVGARWRGALSDDYQLMRVMREADLEIAFVPGAMCASVGDWSLREVFEFTTRQMKITRVYAPRLWVSGMLGGFLFNLVAVSGLVLAATGPSAGRAASVAALSLVWGASVGKAFIRLRAVELSMPAFSADIRAQTLPQMFLWTVTPALFLWNCLAAWLSRTVVWRGIGYRMVSPERTEVLGQASESES